MKISVATASYNSEATIGFTIESFMAQNHPEKEMQVIDGASKIIESFGSDAIHVFSEDRGIYETMNKGFHLFQGDVVGFLNSDDTFQDSRALLDIAADAGLRHVYGDLAVASASCDAISRLRRVRLERTAPFR